MAYGKIDPKLEYSGRRMIEAVEYMIRAEIAPYSAQIEQLRQRIEQLERERGIPEVSAEPDTEKAVASNAG